MTDTSQQWVQRARKGDRTAFRNLVVEHSTAMYRLACRLTGSDTAADDVVQEAWIKAHRYLDRFDERARFSTWIHRITVNAAMDYLRKERSRDRYEYSPPEDMPEPAAPQQPCPAEADDWERLTLAALGRLSDLERAAFTLRHPSGKSANCCNWATAPASRPYFVPCTSCAPSYNQW